MDTLYFLAFFGAVILISGFVLTKEGISDIFNLSAHSSGYEIFESIFKTAYGLIFLFASICLARFGIYSLPL